MIDAQPSATERNRAAMALPCFRKLRFSALKTAPTGTEVDPYDIARRIMHNLERPELVQYQLRSVDEQVTNAERRVDELQHRVHAEPQNLALQTEYEVAERRLREARERQGLAYTHVFQEIEEMKRIISSATQGGMFTYPVLDQAAANRGA